MFPIEQHGLAATKGYLRYLVQTSSSSLPEPVQRRAVEALDKFRRQFEQQLHCRYAHSHTLLGIWPAAHMREQELTLGVFSTEPHTWHVLGLLEELMYDAASISQRPKTDATQAALRYHRPPLFRSTPQGTTRDSVLCRLFIRAYTEAEEVLGELPAEHIFNVALLHMILSPTDASVRFLRVTVADPFETVRRN